jgi:SAM-dependent methyltransferase
MTSIEDGFNMQGIASERPLYTVDASGIYRPILSVRHRDEEYDQSGFDTLVAMQERHFWYRGRHRFLLAALDRFLGDGGSLKAAVDLGGGVGGWVRYLSDHRASRFSLLALADSSETALRLAGDVLPAGVARYQIDLMNLGWDAQWDCAFLLDVIEHLPDDTQSIREAAKALKPGGLLFVTTPAFPRFWSYNDDLAHHLRRYTRKDYAALAQKIGLELLDARYFMFFLSPIYLLSRIKPGFDKLTDAHKQAIIIKQHQVPPGPINAALNAVFGAETPLGHWLRFPWGTSLLGVFRRP